MEYKGKLFGKVGAGYIPLIATTDDFEALTNRVAVLQQENETLREKLAALSSTKILFTDTRSGHETNNPIATLIEFPNPINTATLRIIERADPSASSLGGRWQFIVEEGQLEHCVLSSGRKSDYQESDYDEEFRLKTGMY